MGNTVSGARKKHRRGWNGGEAPSLYARTGGRKYLNRAERGRALAAMEQLERDRALFALTLAWTGARISEVLALTRASFQVECGVVAVHTLKRRTHAVREIPLPPEVMQALDRQFDLSAHGVSKHRGAPHLATERLWPWSRVTGWRIIKEVMRRSLVEGDHACPRGLRHAFGIGTLQAGVPINLAQRWLGHSRLTTTAIYAAACGPEERMFAGRFWQGAERVDEGATC